MELLATAAEMQGWDRAAIDGCGIPGLLLMENAGRGVVDELERTLGGLGAKSVVVFCGKGNNGGDGFVIARLLLGRGARVVVVLISSPSDLRGDAATNFAILSSVQAASGDTLSIVPVQALSTVSPPDVIVDALLGTGFTGTPKGPVCEAIEWINRSEAFVVAVDVPSGVDATTGIVEGLAVRAGLTVTMGCRKIGHVVGEGRELSGEVRVADIGIPPAVVVPPAAPTFLAGRDDVRSVLPVRPRRAHKYSVGKVFVLGGSRGFTGAPVLAAASALRAGAGAVILGVPRSIHAPLVARAREIILAPLEETPAGTVGAAAEQEILERMAWADVVAVGPGTGRNEETDALLRRLVGACPRTLVLDADGLTAMAGHTALLGERTSPTILTPHTGELQRLTGVPAAQLELRRVEGARVAARTLRCIVSLKGSPTVTADPSGTVVVNPTGNPGMATIGSGDVLTGVVAGLRAQGMEPFVAAWTGVYLHGLAGDLAASRFGQRSIVATDLLDHLSAAIQSVEGGS